jgi:heme-degrading monooxygenase HmoA
MAFIRIWLYEVKPEYFKEFENAYCENGDWAKLFRNSKGYVKTELLIDSHNRNRFITIDYWDSENSFRILKDNFHNEYEALDKKCDNLTVLEEELGDFIQNGTGS